MYLPWSMGDTFSAMLPLTDLNSAASCRESPFFLKDKAQQIQSYKIRIHHKSIVVIMFLFSKEWIFLNFKYIIVFNFIIVLTDFFLKFYKWLKEGQHNSPFFASVLGVLVKWVVKPGPGREFRNWKPGFCLYHQKYTFNQIEIHTHDSVYVYVYSLTISAWNIGYFSKYHRLLFSRMVKWVASPDLTFLCFKVVFQL